MTISPRGAFWVWNPEVQKHHIHIVLTHPEIWQGKESVLMVNITSVRPKIAYDDTVEVCPDDYPEVVRHLSYIWFERAAFKPVQELSDECRTTMSGGGTYASRLPPPSKALFERICDGLQESIDAKEWAQDYCFPRCRATARS
ncbi:hypothetical protein BH11ARM2_BH11ARM2_16340 [soil metagenome]